MIPIEITRALFSSPTFKNVIEIIKSGKDPIGINEETQKNILHLVAQRFNSRHSQVEAKELVDLIFEKLGKEQFNDYLLMRDFAGHTPLVSSLQSSST